MQDKLVVKFAGEQRELFMSYRRLNSCLRVLGNPENLTLMPLDPDMSENMVAIMVAAKAGPGEMFDVELNEDDLTQEDFDSIIFWVQEHLQDFFVKRLQQAALTNKALEPLLKDLQLPEAGSAS